MDEIERRSTVVVVEDASSKLFVQVPSRVTIRVDESKLLETEVREQVLIESGQPDVYVLAAGAQGPAGVDGSVLAAQLTKTAGASLSGHRAVVLNNDGEAIYADSSTISHRDKVLGITTGAASAAAPVTIQTYGELVEPSWAWTLDEPVFLGLTGLLTQTVPVSGFVQRIGFPLTATSLFIDVDDAVTL